MYNYSLHLFFSEVATINEIPTGFVLFKESEYSQLEQQVLFEEMKKFQILGKLNQCQGDLCFFLRCGKTQEYSFW